MIPDPLIGQQLGDYTVVSLLGRGGMARVYKGYDARLERYAAVKVIDAQLINSGDAEEYRERFHREARSIGRLRHANIVNVYQFGEYSNLYYMAMVFIEGRDLGHMLRQHAHEKTRMAYGQVIRIAHDIADALDYAHREGVIHRDIKPSNIMVMSDGHAILTDFGLALSVPEGSMGNTFGSAHYIAPEQAIASNNAVPQSDLYSLGVVLYQMLAGKVPFDDPSAMSVAIKHLQEPPPAPSQYNPDLPATAEAVLLKALSKRPEGRYTSGVALVGALENALRLGGRNVDYAKAATSSVVERVVNTPTPPSIDSSSTMMLPPDEPTSKDKPLPVIKPLAGTSKPKLPEVQPSPPTPLPKGEGLPDAKLLLRRGRLPLPALIGAAVGLAIVALLLLNRGNSGAALNPTTATRATTPRPTLDALAAVSSLLPPTDVPPPTLTDLPTQTATATRAATVEPTTAPTLAPTAAAVMPTQPEAASEDALRLRYNDEMLTLTNMSRSVIDLSDIEFAQTLTDGTERVFRANQWSSGTFNIARLRAGDCVQVLTDALLTVEPPESCTRQSWRSVSRLRWFWVSSADDAAFVVRRDGDLLATCMIAAGECGFSLG